MKVKVKNKKRFSLWCFVLVFMFLNLAFAISKRSSADKMASNDSSISTSHVALAADKDGSISSQENKYFKKYVIDCVNDLDNIKREDSKEFIEIHFNKNDISKINLKGEKISSKDIYYDDNSKDKTVIKIKKNYDENNFVYVDKNDSKKVIVLVAKEEKPFHHIVVLDPGHGGEDKGANYRSIYEKDITLKIANYAAEELRFNGFKVVQTRDSDKLLSLREIGDITNAASGDVFVSVHINDNKSSIYKGVNTYYYDPNDYQKDERIKFANIMQKELAKNDNWEDRGIMRQNLAVLRYSEIPCVLVECGFLSNPEDREKLTRDEVLKNFAVNITKGIQKYLEVE